MQTVAVIQRKITEVFVTPSAYKKSKYKETFMDLIATMGLGRESIHKGIKDYDNEGNVLPEFDPFIFSRGDEEDSASYDPILRYLSDNHIHGVRVDLGQNLPDSLLYFEHLWTLRKNASIPSSELRLRGEKPIFRYTLAGSTDIVVKADQNNIIVIVTREGFV